MSLNHDELNPDVVNPTSVSDPDAFKEAFKQNKNLNHLLFMMKVLNNLNITASIYLPYSSDVDIEVPVVVFYNPYNPLSYLGAFVMVITAFIQSEYKSLFLFYQIMKCELNLFSRKDFLEVKEVIRTSKQFNNTYKNFIAVTKRNSNN